LALIYLQWIEAGSSSKKYFLAFGVFFQKYIVAQGGHD